MPWVFHVAAPTQDIDKVILDLQAKLNEIAAATAHGPRTAATAKVVTSDQSGGDARGVVFYNESELPLNPPGGVNWQAQTFWTMTGYEDDLYLPAANCLNGMLNELAVCAHATMTNFRKGHATLTVWYPTTMSA
jgi:hypothetical protein